MFSDLIDELLQSSQYSGILGDVTEYGKYGYKKYEIDVDEELSKKIKKAKGHYTTINCSKIFTCLHTVQNYVAQRLANSIQKFICIKKKKPRVMVVGLGNGGMVADSLGVACGQKLLVTQGVPDELRKELGNLCYLEPKVKGVTGINSFDIISGVVGNVKPDVVILIDTLCANDISRLACSFQLSNAGILPGAGVGNSTKMLNKEFLKCEVIALGVPLIISGASMGVDSQECANIHFTPKEIDFYIRACANVIGSAINMAVHGKEYKKYEL